MAPSFVSKRILIYVTIYEAVASTASTFFNLNDLSNCKVCWFTRFTVLSNCWITPVNKKTIVGAVIFLTLALLVFGASLKSFQLRRWEWDAPKITEVSEKMVGLYIDNLNELNSYEEFPDIIGWFENWYLDEAQNKIAEIGKYNFAIPLITWQPTDVPPKEIAAGLHDEYIKSFLTKVNENARNSDVLIRFAHEMEMAPNYPAAWYSWQGGPPEDYVAAWRRVVTIGRRLAPNVKWIWSPNRATEYADPYYPGSEWVDYVGVTVNKTSAEKRFLDFGDYYMLRGRRHLEQYGKKIVLAEVAYSPRVMKDERKCQLEYVKGVFRYFQRDPHIIAVVFFNKDVDDRRQYQFMDIEEGRQAWFDGVRALRSHK